MTEIASLEPGNRFEMDGDVYVVVSKFYSASGRVTGVEVRVHDTIGGHEKPGFLFGVPPLGGYKQTA